MYEIHAREVNGKVVFRAWNIFTKAYVTKELNREALNRRLKAIALAVGKRAKIDRSSVITQHNHTFRVRIARAIQNGTSDIEVTERLDFSSPWQEQGVP